LYSFSCDVYSSNAASWATLFLNNFVRLPLKTLPQPSTCRRNFWLLLSVLSRLVPVNNFLIHSF
jgi:hypothetical protein